MICRAATRPSVPAFTVIHDSSGRVREAAVNLCLGWPEAGAPVSPWPEWPVSQKVEACVVLAAPVPHLAVTALAVVVWQVPLLSPPVNRTAAMMSRAGTTVTGATPRTSPAVSSGRLVVVTAGAL